MAGSGAAQGFDSSSFRNAIRSTMIMAAPGATNLQATFRWTEQKTFGHADSSGQPYDWTSTPSSNTTHADVKVPCAVKFNYGAGDETPVGRFSNTRVELTLLDVDYDQIEGATQVLLGGKVYDIIGVPMPEALFDVTVWTLLAEAQSAT